MLSKHTQLLPTCQASSNENFAPLFVFGEETLLPISVQLLSPDNVVDLCQLLSNSSQAGMLVDDCVSESGWKTEKNTLWGQ